MSKINDINFHRRKRRQNIFNDLRSLDQQWLCIDFSKQSEFSSYETSNTQPPTPAQGVQDTQIAHSAADAESNQNPFCRAKDEHSTVIHNPRNSAGSVAADLGLPENLFDDYTSMLASQRFDDAPPPIIAAAKHPKQIRSQRQPSNKKPMPQIVKKHDKNNKSFAVRLIRLLKNNPRTQQADQAPVYRDYGLLFVLFFLVGVMFYQSLAMNHLTDNVRAFAMQIERGLPH